LTATPLIDKLKQLIDRTVRLAFADGEVLVGKLEFVIEEDDSIIFELVWSNRPDKYERSDLRPTVRGRISEILECSVDGP